MSGKINIESTQKIVLGFYLRRNLKKLSTKYQSYPKSGKIYAIEQKICKCHSPNNNILDIYYYVSEAAEVIQEIYFVLFISEPRDLNSNRIKKHFLTHDFGCLILQKKLLFSLDSNTFHFLFAMQMWKKIPFLRFRRKNGFELN